MALKKVRLFDIVGQDGKLIETVETLHESTSMFLSDAAAAIVVYEVLRNENGGTSGHKLVLRFYTKEDFNDDIERGDIKIEQR